MISKDSTFLGYRRENGRVGVRNHVLLLPLDDLSNAAVRRWVAPVSGSLNLEGKLVLNVGADAN